MLMEILLIYLVKNWLLKVLTALLQQVSFILNPLKLLGNWLKTRQQVEGSQVEFFTVGKT